jgi:hypothetical protein
MKPIHDTAKVLPDGHLPLPEDFQVRAGEEVDVVITALLPGNGDAEAPSRADHLLRDWAGIGRGSGAGVAERHDGILYPRQA